MQSSADSLGDIYGVDAVIRQDQPRARSPHTGATARKFQSSTFELRQPGLLQRQGPLRRIDDRPRVCQQDIEIATLSRAPFGERRSTIERLFRSEGLDLQDAPEPLVLHQRVEIWRPLALLG